MTDLMVDDLTKRLYETLDALEAQDIDVDYLLVNLLSKNVSKEPDEGAGLLKFIMAKAKELPENQAVAFAGGIATLGVGVLSHVLPADEFESLLERIISGLKKVH